MTTQPRLMPVEEAAKRYSAEMGSRTGRDTMKRMIVDGHVPGASKVGGRYLIDRVVFEAWLRDPVAFWQGPREVRPLLYRVDSIARKRAS